MPDVSTFINNEDVALVFLPKKKLFCTMSCVLIVLFIVDKDPLFKISSNSSFVKDTIQFSGFKSYK